MSGICGIMDIENHSVELDRLYSMSLALSLRGRKRSSAFCEGRVGMLYRSSESNAFCEDEDRQPHICRRRGKSYALCIDSDGIESGAVLEKYFVCGIEAIGAIDGAFALAIYDGERDILLLARDRAGQRPLFYSYNGKKLYFSSEVKGILSACDTAAEVDREVLARHLTSPMGTYGAADIYCDVGEVLAGECILFTSMGMSRFFYRDTKGSQRLSGKRRAKRDTPTLPYPTRDELLFESLNESLIAFDYPQFDCHIPSLCRMLSVAAHECRERICFEDPTLSFSRAYSYERRDRLGNLYGVVARGIPMQGRGKKDNSLEKMCEALYARFSSLDGRDARLLGAIFGSARFDVIRGALERQTVKKEDAENSIRILGMLLETVEWAQASRLLIKSASQSICYDCM